MKNLFILIFLVVSISLKSGTKYRLTYSDTLMLLGEKAYKEKDLLGAIYYIDSCILLNPKNDQCRYTRGKVAYEMKNYELGKKLFKDVLILTNYKDAVSWNMLGICCQELKQYDSAEMCFKNAVRIKTEESKFYANWGKNEYLRGNYVHAEQLYSTAVFLSPDYAPHVINRAEVLKKLGKEQQAQNEMKEFLNKYPKSEEIQNKLDDMSETFWTRNFPFIVAGLTFIIIISMLYLKRRKRPNL